MKVSELVSFLQSLDQDAVVVDRKCGEVRELLSLDIDVSESDVTEYTADGDVIQGTFVYIDVWS